MPIITLTISVVCSLLYFIYGAAPDALVFQREVIEQGRVGQLISSHFVHTDMAHLLWNQAGLLVLGCLFERKASNQILLYLIAGVISVSCYVVFFSGLDAYAGLSGVLNSLLAAVLIQFYLDRGTRFYAVLTGIGAISKLLIETVTNDALFTHNAWPSVPAAHVFGFVGGLITGVLIHLTCPSTKRSSIRLRHRGRIQTT